MSDGYLVIDAGLGCMVIAERLDTTSIAAFIYMVPHIIPHSDLSPNKRTAKRLLVVS